ncbi:MAG: DedA family protein [Pseudobdellovibrionaceae bacterium]
MHFAHDQVFQTLAQYAYEPLMVYLIVFIMMIASGFGFPLPEEVQIVAVGTLAYMGAHPELFPPPYAGAPVINGYQAAAFVSFSVIIADNLVFWIGRTGGRKLMRIERFRKIFESKVMSRVHHFAHKYGVYAAFIFRFTPGLRFPAHLFLGMSHFSAVAFFLVDALAVIISVPTQILLIYHFGEPIFATLYKIKTILGIVLGLILIYVIGHKLWLRYKRSPAAD